MGIQCLERVKLLNVSSGGLIEQGLAADPIIIGIYREVPAARIPGGSEDVMLDLAVRQLVKNYKSQTKILERPRGSSKL